MRSVHYCLPAPLAANACTVRESYRFAQLAVMVMATAAVTQAALMVGQASATDYY